MKPAEHAAQLAEALRDIASFADSAIQQDILNGEECYPMMESIRAALTAWDRHNAPPAEQTALDL
jgi:hypothetical protein